MSSVRNVKVWNLCWRSVFKITQVCQKPNFSAGPVKFSLIGLTNVANLFVRSVKKFLTDCEKFRPVGPTDLCKWFLISYTTCIWIVWLTVLSKYHLNPALHSGKINWNCPDYFTTYKYFNIKVTLPDYCSGKYSALLLLLYFENHALSKCNP